MITNLLVANRGEIARRVFRSARESGIGTVAVYSDADAHSPHVAEADVSVHLPGNTPGETYLRSELIVEAALRAGADAIHPGYGFLSENAEFARTVLDAGLTWVGPPPKAIEQMASKLAAKRQMEQAGVPLLPTTDPESVGAADLPVLIKASAGGGGRGMRIVRDLADLPDATSSARAEAESAFGDPTVFCERYLETGRHIEVQVLADAHGTVWALGERECSIQRRHQKVVEEAPSPWVDPPQRERLFTAARRAAEAVGYVGAGTVEFLAGEDGQFYFLEMNTRLQVEHPVTECVTGLDLVALQLRVADGLPLTDEPPQWTGHAVEARLYAETLVLDGDSARWQPHSGTLHRLDVPGVAAEFAVPGRYGIRLDSGVVDGSVIGVHYDPMLAKVIAWGPDRSTAARSLSSALARTRIHGLATNRDVLVNILRHPEFLSGHTDTAFLDRHDPSTLARPLADPEAVRLSALAAALATAEANRRSATVLGRLPTGWRNVVSAPQQKSYQAGDAGIDIAYRHTRDGLQADGFDGVTLIEAAPDLVVLNIGGVRRAFEVVRYGERVEVDSPLGPVTLVAQPRFPDPRPVAEKGSLAAPMPGTVSQVAVAKGDRVRTGQPLLWLEAMKMQHQITALSDGVVSELAVTAGQQVELGALLAVVTDEEQK